MAELLHELGYSLQANFKVIEGAQHPDRDGQFGYINEQVRRHLLDHHDTGLISIEPRYLRIAHCSVDEAALSELARRLERGIAELAA